jgi:hypothetical protein
MKQQPEITSASAVEPYSFSKDKLPKALSYPLKRSLLDAALRSAVVYQSVYSVRYLGHPNGSTILNAMFSPEQYGDFGSGKVLITIWAVQAHERQATELMLIDDGLPTLCAWLAKAQAEGNAWRGFGHSLTLEIVDGKLRHIEQ